MTEENRGVSWPTQFFSGLESCRHRFSEGCKVTDIYFL